MSVHRWAGLLMVVCLACVTAYAGSPEARRPRYQHPASIARWGIPVDPDADCMIRRHGPKLTITVPNTLHDLSNEIDTTNAPSVVRPVAGDFVAEVYVSGTLDPTFPGTRPEYLPYNGAGLLAWGDDNHFVRLERAAFIDPYYGVYLYANFEVRTKLAPVHWQTLQIPDGPLYLRLERHGETMTGSISHNGVTWTKIATMPVDLPRATKVGVDAVNTSAHPYTADFQRLSVQLVHPGHRGG